MIRSVLIIAAVLSPLWFPYPLTLVLSFAASLVLPGAGLFVGIFTDVLYFNPQVSMIPVASVTGAAISLGAVLVRRFVKARIIHG